MSQTAFLRLQHSESIVCTMASQLLSAYITSGQLTPENEEQLLNHSAVLAIKLARRIDRVMESDDENSDGRG